MKNKHALSGLYQWPNSITSLVLIALISSCSSMNNAAVDDGQCWSRSGGVGKLIKNSSTKVKCEELGGKSWCRIGGACENIP